MIRAVAIELGRYVHVLSTARGRAHRFSFYTGNWSTHLRGSPERGSFIAARVAEELKRRGCKSPFISIRVAS